MEFSTSVIKISVGLSIPDFGKDNTVFPDGELSKDAESGVTWKYVTSSFLPPEFMALSRICKSKSIAAEVMPAGIMPVK